MLFFRSIITSFNSFPYNKSPALISGVPVPDRGKPLSKGHRADLQANRHTQSVPDRDYGREETAVPKQALGKVDNDPTCFVRFFLQNPSGPERVIGDEQTSFL